MAKRRCWKRAIPRHFLSGLTHLTWNHTSEPTVILHTCTMDVFGDAQAMETPEGAFAVTRAEDRRSASASPGKGAGSGSPYSAASN